MAPARGISTTANTSATGDAVDSSGPSRIDDRILAFLAFRPQLLHALDAKRPAWPSPRSWEMASNLLRAGLSVSPAVGEAAASEFEGFCSVYAMLPELEAILSNGANAALAWPDEPSARYALTLGLANRADTATRALNGFRWLASRSTAEWVQLYATDVTWRLRSRGQLGELVNISDAEPTFRGFLDDYAHLTGHGPSGAPATSTGDDATASDSPSVSV
jgi:hypothetical protein